MVINQKPTHYAIQNMTFLRKTFFLWIVFPFVFLAFFLDIVH